MKASSLLMTLIALCSCGQMPTTASQVQSQSAHPNSEIALACESMDPTFSPHIYLTLSFGADSKMYLETTTPGFPGPITVLEEFAIEGEFTKPKAKFNYADGTLEVEYLNNGYIKGVLNAEDELVCQDVETVDIQTPEVSILPATEFDAPTEQAGEEAALEYQPGDAGDFDNRPVEDGVILPAAE